MQLPIIVWRGFGIFVLVAFFLGGVITMLLPPMAEYEKLVYFYGLGTLNCYILDKLIKKRRSATCEIRTMVNEKTGRGKTLYYKRIGVNQLELVEDTFFWIPVPVWCYICSVLGIGTFVTGIMV